MSEVGRPDLSIVIAWQKAQLSVQECLDSIYKQHTAVSFEVILVYFGFDPDLSSVRANYPELRIEKHPSSGSIPSLHGLGISLAAGKYIAISEAHTTFAPDWINIAFSASSASSDSAIGGVVEPGPSLSSVDFALYLCDYAQFASPMESGVSDDLPGNNIVFKREAIEQFQLGRNLSVEGFWKTFFCQKLEQSGKKLSRDSKMVAYYNRHLTLPEVMIRRYHHGRCFGAMRSADFSAIKKLQYSAACSILTIVLFNRLIAKVSKKPSLLQRFCLVNHLCYLIVYAWVAGEYFGTVNGAGTSCDQL
jgi:hypothetical protein